MQYGEHMFVSLPIPTRGIHYTYYLENSNVQPGQSVTEVFNREKYYKKKAKKANKDNK